MDDRLISKVRESYLKPGLAFEKKETGGFLSQNFILAEGGKRFFLKIYRQSEASRVAEIHAAKFFFAENGIPAILPLKTAEGSTFFEFQGNACAFFPFVAGKHASPDAPSDKEVWELGALLAKIHLLSKKPFPLVQKKDRKAKGTFEERMKTVEAAMGDCPKDPEFDALAAKIIALKRSLADSVALSENRSESLPFDHLIHGDFHGGNVFFDDSDNVLAVFDFEMVQLSPRAYELVRSMMYVCFEGVFEDENFRRAGIYLSAYASVYPISAEEFAQGVDMFFSSKGQSVWIEKTHYVERSTRVDHFLLKEYRALLYLKDHRAEFLKRLSPSLS